MEDEKRALRRGFRCGVVVAVGVAVLEGALSFFVKPSWWWLFCPLVVGVVAMVAFCLDEPCFQAKEEACERKN